jgi:hypothetical protein
VAGQGVWRAPDEAAGQGPAQPTAGAPQQVPEHPPEREAQRAPQQQPEPRPQGEPQPGLDGGPDRVAAVRRQLRVLAVGLPALLAGAFEFIRHTLFAHTGLPEDIANLVTAALAALAGLVYFETVSSLVQRLSAEAEQARAERRVAARQQAIADDLHDRLSQALFFLNVRLRKIQERLRAGPGGDGLDGEVAEAVAAAEDAYLEVRETIRRLQRAGQPAEEAGDDGERALEHLVRTALEGSDLTLEVAVSRSDGRPPMPPQRWSAVRGILLEALRNARKHAGASHMRVRWTSRTTASGSTPARPRGTDWRPCAAAPRRRAWGCASRARPDAAPASRSRGAGRDVV